MYSLCALVLEFKTCYILFFSLFFFFKQKTAYEMRISDWSSDVCSSDLGQAGDHTHKVLLLDLAEAELADAGEFLEVATRQANGVGLLFHEDFLDRLARQIGDLAFEVPDSRLARVIADQEIGRAHV